jgi:hypothetical protein
MLNATGATKITAACTGLEGLKVPSSGDFHPDTVFGSLRGMSKYAKS